jgi:hypothetical protein
MHHVAVKATGFQAGQQLCKAPCSSALHPISPTAHEELIFKIDISYISVNVPHVETRERHSFLGSCSANGADGLALAQLAVDKVGSTPSSFKTARIDVVRQYGGARQWSGRSLV